MAPMQQKSLKKWSFHLRYSAVEEWVANNVISSQFEIEIFEIGRKRQAGWYHGSPYSSRPLSKKMKGDESFCYCFEFL